MVIIQNYNLNMLTNAFEYKGTWDASTAAYPAPVLLETGWVYVCNVAGNVGNVSFAIGDEIVYNGTTWDKISGMSDYGVNIIYVGKNGNATNTGLSWSQSLLTFTTAIALVNTLAPTVNNRYVIECFDSGIYTEDITFTDQYVTIHAPLVTLVGSVVILDNCNIYLHELQEAAGIALSKLAGTSLSIIEIDIITITAATFGLVNAAINATVYLKCKQMTIATGCGIGDGGAFTPDGTNIIDIGVIIINGIGGTAISRNNVGNMSGKVGMIIEAGAGIGSGIALDINGGTSSLNIDRITTTVAYNIAAAAILNLNCLNITGTRTINATGTLRLNSLSKILIPTIINGNHVGLTWFQLDESSTDEIYAMFSVPIDFPVDDIIRVKVSAYWNGANEAVGVAAGIHISIWSRAAGERIDVGDAADIVTQDLPFAPANQYLKIANVQYDIAGGTVAVGDTILILIEQNNTAYPTALVTDIRVKDIYLEVI